MHIFISEFFSGGGLSHQDIPGSLLSEGYAMLSAVVNDVKRYNPDIKIATTLDYRINNYYPPLNVDSHIDIDEKDDFVSFFERMKIRMVDSALIIAPESGKILTNLTKIVEEDMNLANLGCGYKAIDTCTNKFETINSIKNVNVKIPKTKVMKLNNTNVIDEILNFPVPLVIKPIDGVAGSGISLIEDHDIKKVEQAILKLKKETTENEFLVQEFISGLNISVSLVTNSEIFIPLSVNFQNIDLKADNSEYQGGHVPYRDINQQELHDKSIKIIQAIEGLNGYVGIDYVVNESGIYFMEINPRITTSYIGIQKTLNENVAKYLINLEYLEEHKNDILEYRGVAYFSKVYHDIYSTKKLKKFIKNDPLVHELIAPPFKVNKEDEKETCCAFLCTVGKDLNEAQNRFEERKNILIKKLNF